MAEQIDEINRLTRELEAVEDKLHNMTLEWAAQGDELAEAQRELAARDEAIEAITHWDAKPTSVTLNEARARVAAREEELASLRREWSELSDMIRETGMMSGPWNARELVNAMRGLIAERDSLRRQADADAETCKLATIWNHAVTRAIETEYVEDEDAAAEAEADLHRHLDNLAARERKPCTTHNWIGLMDGDTVCLHCGAVDLIVAARERGETKNPHVCPHGNDPLTCVWPSCAC